MMLYASVAQFFSPNIPLADVPCSEIPLEVTHDDVITSYFQIGRPWWELPSLVRDSKLTGKLFLVLENHALLLWLDLPITIGSSCCGLIAWRWVLGIPPSTAVLLVDNPSLRGEISPLVRSSGIIYHRFCELCFENTLIYISGFCFCL